MARTLVVIPTLGGRPDWLRATMRSVRAQGDAVDLRVVAPSSAPIGDLCREFDAEVVILDEPGLSRALNVGLDLETDVVPNYEYAAWIGDDDLFAPGSIAASMEALDRDPRATAAVGRCRFIGSSGDTLWMFNTPRWAAWYSQYGSDLIPQPGSLFRYRALFSAGGIDESYKRAMDYDLFLRLRELGRIVRVDRELGAFRVHEESITSSAAEAGPSEGDRARLENARRRGRHRDYPAARAVTRWTDKLVIRLIRVRRHADPPRFGAIPYTAL